MPSIEGRIDRAIADGAAPSKLGIGGVFYGYVWKGADGPNQPIDNVTVTANKPYHAIMEDDFEASAYRWHDGVEAAYLSLTGSNAKESRFVSFDDEKTIAAKVDWLRARGLGGMIVWELGGGYRPNLPAGQRHPLLAAVKAAAFGGPSP